jgi:hypothetical protein
MVWMFSTAVHLGVSMFDRRRVALAGLAAVPLLLLAAACKDDGGSALDLSGGGGGGAAAGASTSGASAPSSNGLPMGSGGQDGTGYPSASSSGSGSASGSGDASALSGVWTGQYTCRQGNTTMRLHLSGLNDKVTGTFDFGGQGGVPAGSYTVSGTLAGGKVTLTGGEWIKQPDGFAMVAFDVTSMSATALSGTVAGEGCTTFQVTKTSSN